jgi:hypothetical protein
MNRKTITNFLKLIIIKIIWRGEEQNLKKKIANTQFGWNGLTKVQDDWVINRVISRKVY